MIAKLFIYFDTPRNPRKFLEVINFTENLGLIPSSIASGERSSIPNVLPQTRINSLKCKSVVFYQLIFANIHQFISQKEFGDIYKIISMRNRRTVSTQIKAKTFIRQCE